MRAQHKIAPLASVDRWEPPPVRRGDTLKDRLNASAVWAAAPRAVGVLVLLGAALVAGRALTNGAPAEQQGVLGAPAVFADSAPLVAQGFGANPPPSPPDLSTLAFTRDIAQPVPAEAQAGGEAKSLPQALAEKAAARNSQLTLAATAPASAPAAVDVPQPERAAKPVAEPPFAWPKEAVNCPRTWIGGSDLGDPNLACHEFASLPSNASNPALEAAAAAERPPAATAEPPPAVGGEHSLPPEAAPGIEPARLPLARPAEPPKLASAPRRSRKAARSWPDGAPPDCGSKRARWRYADRKGGKKVWFCK